MKRIYDHSVEGEFKSVRDCSLTPTHQFLS